MDKLQQVLNAAAHIITGTRKFDRGLGQILHDQLHWLDVPDRVLFKLSVTVHQCLNGRTPPYLSEHCILVSSADTRRHLRSTNSHLLAIPCVSGSTLKAVGRSQLLAGWPGTHSRILSVLGIYLKHTCSCDTSSSSELGVFNDYVLSAIYIHAMHSLTLSLTPISLPCLPFKLYINIFLQQHAPDVANCAFGSHTFATLIQMSPVTRLHN